MLAPLPASQQQQDN